MGVITRPNDFSPQTTIVSAQVDNDFNTLYNEFNGNIDNSNIKSAAAISVTKLSGGTDGQVLTTSGSTPTWGTSQSGGAQRVQVHRTTNQSISNDTLTAVIWDNEDYDTDTMHDNVTANTRITFNTDGWYFVSCSISWDFGTGRRYSFLRKNGATPLIQNEGAGHNATYSQAVNIAGIFQFVATDYVEVQVNQSSGSPLILAGSSPNHFQAVKLF